MSTNPRRRATTVNKTTNTPKPAAAKQPDAPATDAPSPDAPDIGGEATTFIPGPMTYTIPGTDRRAFYDDLVRIAKADLIYGQQLAALAASGWKFQLEQQLAIHSPTGTLVNFAILFGREIDQLQAADYVSILVPQHVVHVSLWARNTIIPDVLFTLFGIAPPITEPAPAQQDAQQPTTDPGSTDGGLDAAPGADEAEWEPLALIESYSPDGIPVFLDPFTLGDDKDDIIDSLITLLTTAMPTINSLPMLAAFWELNTVAIDFIRQMSPSDEPQIKELFEARRVELEPLVPSRAPAGRRERGRPVRAAS